MIGLLGREKVWQYPYSIQYKSVTNGQPTTSNALCITSSSKKILQLNIYQLNFMPYGESMLIFLIQLVNYTKCLFYKYDHFFQN